jgi:hypothetical protein
MRARIFVMRSGLQWIGPTVGRGRLDAGVLARKAGRSSEKRNFSELFGMAMAHWVCVQMLGVESTSAVETLPVGDLRRRKGRDGMEADLWGAHLVEGPRDWLIEAKGALPTGSAAARAKGSQQLDYARARRKWKTPHVQALVCATVEANPVISLELGLPVGASVLSPSYSKPSRWPLVTFGHRRSRVSVHRRRLSVALSLLRSGGAWRQLAGADAYVQEIPESDLAIGLLRSAYHETLQLLEGQVAWADANDPTSDELAERLAAQQLSPEMNEQAELFHAFEVLIGLGGRGSVRLAQLSEDEDDDERMIAVDDVGVLIILGSAWESPLMDDAAPR